MGYKLICDWESVPVTSDESAVIPRWIDPRWNGRLANLAPSLFRARHERRLSEMLSGGEYLRLAGVHVDPFTPARPEALYTVRASTRYAVEENARVELFVELARGAGPNLDRFERMGDLMYQSHYSYTECGLGCEATGLLVELLRREGPRNGLFGAKITGGGAGRTVAVWGLRGSEPSFRRFVRRYAEASGFEPHVFRGGSMGAGRFGVRVFDL